MTEKTTDLSQQIAKATLLSKVARYFLRVMKWCLGLIFPLFVIMLIIDIGTSYFVEDRVYTDITQLPKREYAVVLGTAKFYPSGNPNLYYRYRLDAARLLYQSRKADYFLMSGDNQTPYYNEPKVMTADFRKLGVPSVAIKQDYAGYNTLDSILRADKVFKLKPFTIVSQRFHCERALVIAKFHHIDAVCYVAKYPEQHYKVRIREFIARTGMVVSLLLGTEATTLAESKIVELELKK